MASLCFNSEKGLSVKKGHDNNVIMICLYENTVCNLIKRAFPFKRTWT